MVGISPLLDDEFDRLMTPLGPFEAAPQMAVGVSGGADSIALCLLIDRWLRARGGSLTALTVDHGLRRESRNEAESVARQLADRGVPHVILTWRGDKPTGDRQAAARAARYALLESWCATHGVLHLLLAHHRDDQAETLLLRLGRGSGVDGLAAMAGVATRRQVQLLRPLLPIDRDRLRATLRAAGVDWIEDPSNGDDRYRRVRLRHLLPALATEGLGAERLAATAGRLARARVALETATTGLAVRAVNLHEAGFARLERAVVAAAPADIALRLLARICRTVGGDPYPPRLERLERLWAALRAGQPGRRTLAGCLFVPVRADGSVLVCRELARVAPPSAVEAGEIERVVRWDRRYAVTIRGRVAISVGALGRADGDKARWPDAPRDLPAAVLPTLPCVRDVDGIVDVPHLGYHRPGAPAMIRQCLFAPTFSITGAGHCLVPPQDGIMC